MSRHIGIVACSAEGAALCYRTICTEAPEQMGEHMHPEVSMHTHPLGEYMIHIRSGDWSGVAQLMLSSVNKLAEIGAELAICPDNTIHEAIDQVIAKSPIPWLHIAEVVALEAQSRKFKNLAVIGTKYLMTGPVYPAVLTKYGLDFRIPDESDRIHIDTIIFEEPVNGIIKEESRHYMNDVVRKLKSSGCDAVILGCTEIPLLVKLDDCPLPTLDSSCLLARAALKAALQRNG